MSKVNFRDILHHCRVLSVRIDASREDIKTARDMLLKNVHPDKHADSNAAKLRYYTERTRRINEAYRYLSRHYETLSRYLEPFADQSLTARTTKTHRHAMAYETVENFRGDAQRPLDFQGPLKLGKRALD